MRNVETMKVIVEATEVTEVTGDWGGQIIENLDGIGLSASDKVMSIFPTNTDGVVEPNFRKSQEEHL
jgi:hypothetical protein